MAYVFGTRCIVKRRTDEENEERGKNGVEAAGDHVCNATSDQRNSVADPWTYIIVTVPRLLSSVNMFCAAQTVACN